MMRRKVVRAGEMEETPTLRLDNGLQRPLLQRKYRIPSSKASFELVNVS